MSNYDIIITAVLYAVGLAIFIYYLYLKYKREKYIFSISNAYIFQYAIILFIITPFAFTPIAWVKLLGDSAYSTAAAYYPYLLKSLKINCFGFIIFILALIYNEFSSKRPSGVIKRTLYADKYIIQGFLDLEFLVVILIWLVYSLFVTGGFALFGTSSSSESGASYYVNQAVQVVITMMTFYYGFNYINKKKNLLFFVIGIVVYVLMGKRATLVMDILFGIIVYILYRRVTFSQRVFKKAAKYAVVLVAVALLIGNLRSSSSNNFTILQNLIYGNTFCDIRDGGMILYGFENNSGSEFALGKTYLSAFLSFIPSSLSSLRLKWDWGRYSTTTLLGWKNHPGLRGGWAMEGYLNFGIIGILISQVLSAKVYASLEKYFRMEMFETGKKEISAKAVLPLYIYITLARRITCSSGFFAIYIMILFVSFNVLLGSTYRKSVG